MMTAILILVLLAFLTPYLNRPQAILGAQQPVVADQPAPLADELDRAPLA